jgi:hypothetical protein
MDKLRQEGFRAVIIIPQNDRSSHFTIPLGGQSFDSVQNFLTDQRPRCELLLVESRLDTQQDGEFRRGLHPAECLYGTHAERNQLEGNMLIHFQGVTWTLLVIDILFTIARLSIRLSKVGKWLWDDAAHCVGLALLLSNAVLSTVSWPLFYETRGISTGGTRITAEYLEHDYDHFIAYQLPLAIGYWCCLWSIKIAFLLFYKKFFKDVERYLIAWWIVLSFVISTLVIILVLSVLASGSPKDLFNPRKSVPGKGQYSG